MKLDEEWFDASGCLVTPFSFNSKEKQLIINELKKYVIEESDVEKAFYAIENSVNLEALRKDVDIDELKELKSKLSKIINGLTKTIDALNSLDSVNKELFALENYIATLNIFGIDSPEKIKSNPTKELYTCLEAAKSRLEIVTSPESKLNATSRHLVDQVVTWWIRYTNTRLVPNKARFVWREDEQKSSPYISLSIITKIAMKCSGHYISDPSRYIVEAIERFNIKEKDH